MTIENQKENEMMQDQEMAENRANEQQDENNHQSTEGQHQNTNEENKPNENALQEQLAVANDKYLRLNAEFDNFRKRTARERVDLIQTASLDVLKDLLDVLDDMNRTEEMFKNEQLDKKAMQDGVKLVFAKLRKTLENKGLHSFESIGEPFDVEKHEAITEIPAPNKKMQGKVVDEIHKGYMLNGKLIRHAKVVVGK